MFRTTTPQPNNSTTYNAEMSVVMAEMTAALKRLNAPQKQSSVQHVLSAWADGLAELGQNGAAFVAIWGCGCAIGGGLEQWDYTGALGWWSGAGMVAGGVAVGARVVLDVILGELIEAIQRRSESAIQAVPPEPDRGPLEIETGLWLSDGRGGGVTLLPDLPTPQVLRMAKITAAEYFGGRVKKNFSKRNLGRAWGDYLLAAKDKFAALGYIENLGNNTWAFTDVGAGWLQKVIGQR